MSVSDNLREISNHIPDNVTLIAVSKTQSVEKMQEAYDMGIRDFGENKVQELLAKQDSFNDVRWHFIGNLQKNKVKYLVDRVFLIHSLDRISLLKELEKQYSKINKEVRALIEINIGEESTKGGISLNDLEELIDAVECCNHVKILGLMAIIPPGDEESCRVYFKKMKVIFDNLSGKVYRNIHMKYLSMGMSNDYKIAITEGANIIRIGQGIFGKRKE